MTDRSVFEARLERRLRARAALASRSFDAAGLAREAIAAGTHRRGIGRLGWPSTRPAFAWIIVGLLLAIALLGAVTVAGALLRQPRPVLPSGVSNGWVAFSSGATTRQGNSEVFLVKSGAEERRIGGGGVRAVCPSFSPDGSKLAYSEAPPGVIGNGGQVSVVIVTLDDAGLPVGRAMRLPMSSSQDVCPRWAPDGHTVAFLADGLWIGRLDGTTTRVPGWDVTGDAFQFDWSPDGRAVVAVGNGSSTVWVVPVDGRPARLLERAGPTGDFEYSKWSPDGTRIAVLANTLADHPDGSRTTLGSSIEVYRADGSGSPIELASGTTLSGSFGWSPDGRQVAYVRANEIVIDAPGADDARVIASDPRAIRGLIWSPDGMRLLYVADDGVVSVAAAGDPAPIVLTQQAHDLEYTSSASISWQPVFP